MADKITEAIQARFDSQFARTLNLVQYLDSHFSRMKLWPHWIVLKSSLKRKRYQLQRNSLYNKTKAQKYIWTTFLAINFNQKETFHLQEILDFIVAIDDDELPLYILHLHIAQRIFQGQTEESATEEYRRYLSQSPENAIYEDYAITPDFQVIPTIEYLANFPLPSF